MEILEFHNDSSLIGYQKLIIITRLITLNYLQLNFIFL